MSAAQITPERANDILAGRSTDSRRGDIEALSGYVAGLRAEVQRLRDELARRDGAQGVELLDRFDLGFVEACGILSAKPFDRPSVAASIIHEGGMVGALVTTTSDGPGIAILCKEMHDQIVGHGIASRLVPAPPKPSADVAIVSNGVQAIAEERKRQIEKEGWTPKHDDAHFQGELAAAARCYAMEPGDDPDEQDLPEQWPWDPEWWKPTPHDRRRELSKAGALIAAEIDRLDRLSSIRIRAHAPPQADAVVVSAEECVWSLEDCGPVRGYITSCGDEFAPKHSWTPGGRLKYCPACGKQIALRTSAQAQINDGEG